MDIHFENFESLQTVTVVFATRHGSCFDSNPGLSALLFPTLTRGTKTRSEEEINLLVEGRGARMFTRTMKDYSLVIIRTIPSLLASQIDLLFDILAAPLLDDSLVESQKSNNLEWIAENLDNPSIRQHQYNIGQTLFGDHPFGRPILGFPETVKILSRHDLVDCWESRLFIDPKCVIVGNSRLLDFETVESQILDLFDRNLKDRVSNPSTFPEPSVPPLNLHIVGDDRAKNAFLSLNCRIPEKYRNLAHLTFTSALLGDSFASRLFRIIRDERGLSYIVHSLDGSVMNYDYLSTFIDVAPERIGEALSVKLDIIQDLIRREIPKDEFQMTQDYIQNRMDIYTEDPNYIGESIISSIYHKGPACYEDIQSSLKKVTPSGIKGWYENIFSDATLSLTVDGNFKREEVESLWNTISIEGGA